MASRTSLYWSDSTMEAEDNGGDVEDTRTPLDRTIDSIGMGRYQWILLSLCGFGWLADNMWLQAVAIILPRVQQEYGVSDKYIGAASSAMFAGMMLGAVGWGTCSDMLGRTTAFNATLFLTALFGILSSFSTSFISLSILLFLLGSAVGGSMPTDGTLLLENIPDGKKYLVTALCVFFSVGSVLAAVVGLLVIPQHSCTTAERCDDNYGWKYLLVVLGVVTLAMFTARMLFFTLHESPRYLVHAGRHQEAIESLQMISRYNGDELALELEDVQDSIRPSDSQCTTPRQGDDTRVPFLSADENNYSSTGEFSNGLDGHTFATPTVEHSSIGLEAEPVKDDEENALSRPHLRHASPSTSAHKRISSGYEKRVCSILPMWIRRPLWAWWDRVMNLMLSPEWLRTSVLVWTSWCFMALAYTMFNVFLPKLLESGDGAETLEESLWNVVIFTLGGCPGALLGAYTVESPRFGRRWSLAGSTFITAFFCIIFVHAKSSVAVRTSTVGISLSATTMWAVLYGWTPQIFTTQVRGTAGGVASALSRIGGMIAPMLGGMLLMIDRAFPVYVSAFVFTLAGICVLMLKEEEGDSRRKKDRFAIH